MKLFKLFYFLTVCLIFSQCFDHKSTNENYHPSSLPIAVNIPRERNNWWYCPDNIKGFPPVDIKLWNKVPVVNGRLPTNEETQDGTSLIYYDPYMYPDAKAYNITLPKLASFFDPYTKKRDTVIVIQIAQTIYDTVVGYRYLTGGNGTYNFRDFHFLTDAEVKKAVAQ